MWGVMSDAEDFPDEGRGLTPRVFERLFARINEVCSLLPFGVYNSLRVFCDLISDANDDF